MKKLTVRKELMIMYVPVAMIKTGIWEQTQGMELSKQQLTRMCVPCHR